VTVEGSIFYRGLPSKNAYFSFDTAHIIYSIFSIFSQAVFLVQPDLELTKALVMLFRPPEKAALIQLASDKEFSPDHIDA